MAAENELAMEQQASAPVVTAEATTDGAPGIIAQLGNKFMIVVAIAILIAFMVVFWLWSQQPDYRVLLSNYSDQDGGAIVSALEKMNIPYKFNDNSGAIMVPASEVHHARLKLASEGLPKGGNSGFELLENQKFGVSQFIEQVNFQRALEGELERSIQSIDAVDSARLHLAIPKSSVFIRDKKSPTASVILHLRGGRTLGAQQVGAIVHLVASSVPNLPAKNVTVVDQNGNLLSDMANKKGRNNLDPSQLKYVEEIQRGIIERVESIIAPIVGAKNVRAQATAEVDFSSVDEAAEVYKPNQDPNNAAIRSQQTNESQTANTLEAGGVPGALSNQPPEDARAPIQGGTQPNNTAANAVPVNTQKNATTNFEVDKTVRYVKQNMGGIKRLNVAVVVNNIQETDKDGNITYRPLNDAEKTQIIDLARQAMGFNEARGDALSVVNSAFVADKPEEVQAVPLWQNPLVIEYAKDGLRTLVGLIVLLMIYLKAVKPLVLKLTTEPEPPLLEGEEQAAIEDKVDLSTVVEVDDAGNPLLDDDGKPIPKKLADLSDSQKNLNLARRIAGENPRLVANVVAEWTENG